MLLELSVCHLEIVWISHKGDSRADLRPVKSVWVGLGLAHCLIFYRSIWRVYQMHVLNTQAVCEDMWLLFTQMGVFVNLGPAPNSWFKTSGWREQMGFG